MHAKRVKLFVPLLRRESKTGTFHGCPCLLVLLLLVLVLLGVPPGYPGRSRPWRLPAILNYLLQFLLTNHCSPADLGTLKPALAEPRMDRPLADPSEAACGLV